ncbi:helix-turn-helix domain-containing protein [Polaribacter vadi]|uniref:helix-turn-helix domain-containing protein n=1 Tax=Polaribacter TaxID=52959 RepID=UPI001C084502|nr:MULTISPECIES: helix-turn-helix domain-containing protein [Polaribacter]MBU3011265.1 helix-turn-helix domain-containing protein [Polaribacter vadi]MDO6741078.1 helix-turn-helix domain-containing protein [Polaribacter sp. 1_MG-2023]
MQFINNPKFRHSFYKDVTRINYEEDAKPQLISDYGYTYIMIRYGKIKASNCKNEEVNIPKVFIKGTGNFFKVEAFKDSSWLSFELPNHILHNVTKIHSTKNRNTFIDLSFYVEDDIIESLYYALREIHSIKEITAIADQHLRNYYRDWSVLLPSVEIVQYILNKKGMLPVKELTEVFPYSARTLERMFHKEVGATPYRFICLVRFNYTIRELKTNKHYSLLELIEQYNYFDQSHFEKDFKKFLGQSIKEYKNDNNPLLSNGLARAYVKK